MDVDPTDDSGAVLAAVGRQVRLWREAAGLRPAELGKALGYGENLIYKIESGKRIPRPEFLDRADEVLGAGGRIAAMKKDVEETRYPKKVRDLAKLEARVVELGAYCNHNLPGLLQTEDYTRALFEMRRPAYSTDEVSRHVAARMARQTIFQREPMPTLTFVLEEVTLRRPLGGKSIFRRQLSRLVEVARLRHVEVQVMPTLCEDHAGMGGELRVLKLPDGRTLGQSEGQMSSHLTADPKVVRSVELRYGIIRSQALSPRESLAFIEKVLEET
ncbi:helix-turn-helix domain-containing protein [Streptomyces sp. NPDC059740]|uniref:helix-turn-helix domain-containing protein n=1 Tax=Streptomyces sp. NPDC059740 TaxID=3346926 RepID=UPI00365F30A2